MDFIRAQVARIQQQLAGLSTSQKMLAATLVAIMVITLFFWMRYASSPVMEPVLSQSFKEEDLARITAQLSAKGIPYQTSSDGKILVPVERRQEVIADLAYSQLLPRGMESSFDDIMKQMSPWDPPDKSRMMMIKMKESYLAQMISRFPGVAQAGVIIDPREVTRLGGNSIKPTATVNIVMRSGMPATKQLVHAAADAVSGAQAGLTRSNVTVVIDGQAHLLPDRDAEFGLDGMGGSVLEQRQRAEAYWTNKVLEHLQPFRGCLVSVTVKLDLERRKGRTTSYDKDKTVSMEASSKTRTVERHDGSGGGTGESGVLPNTGMVVGTGANSAVGPSSTEEEAETKNENRFGEAVVDYTRPGGDAEVTTVSVRVPHSYFAAVARASDASKEPDAAAVDQIAKVELEKIRKAVKMATGQVADENISVETYLDAAPLLAATAEVATSSTGVGFVLGGSAKEIAIGALALVSLVMMAMVVRKGATAVPPVEKPVAAQVEELSTGETIAGEALEGSNLLDGMELDEDAVKTQQMLAQVETLVKENPDAAASLVKRWMNK